MPFDTHQISSKSITKARIRGFQKTIWEYYRKHGRKLPWRNTRNPYHVLVSEIMLQQTQVERVKEKYGAFIAACPDFVSLSRASLRHVLSIWHGLGYNRRAIALKQIAGEVVSRYRGSLPSSVDELMRFRGIGRATACAIAAFAFHEPTVFIETNIRRVFLHFFFRDRTNVDDGELLPLVEKSVDHSNPRDWYYALMDYGAMLKKEVVNPNRRSSHYQRQTPFEGSRRQFRGLVLRAILEAPGITKAALIKTLKKEPHTIEKILEQLRKEGFIRKIRNTYSIA